MSITEIYNQKCEENSDICQHLPTLKRYAEDSDIIVELGVRSIVSTWAFLMGKPKELSKNQKAAAKRFAKSTGTKYPSLIANMRGAQAKK